MCFKGAHSNGCTQARKATNPPAVVPSSPLMQCQGLWHVRLAQRLPGRTADQVGDKCCAMVEFAIQVR